MSPLHIKGRFLSPSNIDTWIPIGVIDFYRGGGNAKLRAKCIEIGLNIRASVGINDRYGDARSISR